MTKAEKVLSWFTQMARRYNSMRALPASLASPSFHHTQTQTPAIQLESRFHNEFLIFFYGYFE